MELRHLRYFKVVAELQHFHKASQALFITQPALSNQIKQLEEELGSKLFERIGRGVKLSESGERVLESACRVLSEIENMRDAVEDLESGSRGTLRIGVLQSVNVLYLRKIVLEFDRHYPNISLCIEELANDQIASKVADGEIDLGIGFILPQAYKNIDTEMLFQEKWNVVVAPQHVSKARDIAEGREQDLKAVLLPERFETRKIIDNYFQTHNISIGKITEVNSISCILDLVENGNSFTILPEAFSVFKSQHRLVSYCIDNLAAREVGILTASDRSMKRSVGNFRQLVVKHLSSAGTHSLG